MTNAPEIGKGNRSWRIALWVCVLCAGWLSVITVPAAWAQSASTGAVSGTVIDPSGSAVAAVTITLTNEATSESRAVSSQPNGTYFAPLLLPGIYHLEASKAGFKTLVLTGIHVFVTETETVNVQLQLGEVSQTVTVSGETAALETENPALGHVTSGEMVRDLPLVNRNYTQIIGLSPGVVADVNNASDLGRGGSGLNAATFGLSSHGGATNDNNYQMNGSQVNDLMGSGPFSGGVPIPNPDAIQEFKVQTGQYDASYGRDAGANVDVVTKGGTNEFHGSLFEFLRNDVLNANDFFLNRAGESRASLKQNQFGFALGGPIQKNKLLFFTSYEGTRQINGLDTSAACLSTFITPPELAAAGNRSRASLGAAFAGEMSPFTGQTIAANGSNISQQAINLLDLTLPNGNFLIPTPQNTATGQSSLTQNCRYNADQFVTNLDFIHGKSEFAGRFFFDDGDQNATFPFGFSPTLPGFPQKIRSAFRDFSLTHTYTFTSHLFNQLVLGYNRLNSVAVQGEPLVNVPGQSSPVPFNYALIGVSAPEPDNTFPGIGVFGQFELGGNGQGFSLIQNTYNFEDFISYIRGKHSFRFGGGVSRQEINFEGFHFLGAAIFLDVPDLLLGTVTESEDFAGLPDRAWRAWNGDAFAQDDIKLGSRLTVNLGVRYERQGAIGDNLGRAAIFNIGLANPNPPLGGTLAGYVVASNFSGTIPAGVTRSGTNAAINEDGQNNVAPRIGFAWQLPHTDRLVLRGGYGIYFTRTTGQPFLQLLGAPPFGLIRPQFFQPFSSPFPAAPASVPFFPPYSPATSLTPVTFSPSFRPPIVQEYSMNLQTQLTRNLVLEVGYEGSRGTQLLQQRDFNQALSASPANPIRGQMTNTLANLPMRVPTEGLSPTSSTIIESAGSSWYNALNVSLNKRFSKGLQLLASYTWARSLSADNAYSTSVNGGLPVGNQNDPASRYGPDGFIRPQRLVISYVYDLPGPKDRLSLAGRFLAGWSVAGVTTFQSGHYLTITDTNATNAFGIAGPGGDRPSLAPGCTAGKLATSGSVTSKLNNFLNGACLTGPPVITSDGGTDFGNLGVGVVRGPDQRNFDIAILKKTQLREALNLEFRTEFFNAFNTPQFADPSSTNLIVGTVVGPAFVPSPTFGVITSTSVNPRVIQLALKLNF
jgi:hypothetical protein